jgi:hypothetical protein
MIKFKSFLLEYLTDKQRERYKDVRMTDKARADTDHFFGAGNDKIHGEIEHDDKSEIHHQLEAHLGQPISHEDYKKGTTLDRHGREVKIGRLIKDNDLRNQFDQDPSRKIAKTSTLKTTTVRGTEVAGQTNPEPNAEHPNGHSWHDISCKNVENGINKHYLDKEIQHGTVVHFVHDHNGQEIYRATLHPHHNDEGHTIYSVDAEYGIKHPNFTQDAHRVASQLSGEYKRGTFVKNRNVYNDNGMRYALHPAAPGAEVDKETHEELAKPYEKQSAEKLRVLLTHPNISGETLSHVLHTTQETPADVWGLAAKHPNLKGEHLEKALNSTHSHTATSALKNPNVTAEHLHKVLDAPDTNRNWAQKRAVFESPAVNSSHIEKALKTDPSDDLFHAAAQHPKTTSAQLNVVAQHYPYIALQHRNVKPSNIDKWLDSDDGRLRQGAALHKAATDANLTKALSQDPETRSGTVWAALGNRNIKPHHIEPFLNHSNRELRIAAAESPGISPEQIDKVLDHEKDRHVLSTLIHRTNTKVTDAHLRKVLNGDYPMRVKEKVAEHPNISSDTINKALDFAHQNDNGKMALDALSHDHVTSDNLHHALKLDNPRIESDVLWHNQATPEHWEYVAKHSKSPGNVAVAERFLANGRRG